MGVDPELDSLHGHPRFNDLLRKLNHRLGALPTLPARSLSGEESIAVLPFRILSSPVENTGDEYLGIGLTDALITRLSNVQRLIVRPTSSVLRYRGAGIDPLLAGRDLSVNYIVEGSLQRVGNRLQVTAQLLNVRAEMIHWSQQFDEDSTDVLHIEDSISEQLANALLPQLTRDEQRQSPGRGSDSVEPQRDPLRAEPAFAEILNPAGIGIAAQARASAASQPPRSRERTSITSRVPNPAPQTLDSGNEEARQLYLAAVSSHIEGWCKKA